MISPRGQRLFIPVSLGNHYYSRRVLRRIFVELVAPSQQSIVFVCDRLRELIYRGREPSDESRISGKVDREVTELRRALVNAGLDANAHAQVATWALLDQDPAYTRVLQGLENLVRQDPEVAAYTSELLGKLLLRFYPGRRVSARLLEIQTRYTIVETALSLFVTEKLGFNVECYRRREDGLIVFVYARKRTELRRILGKDSLERRFLPLEDLFDSGRSPGGLDELMPLTKSA